MPEGDTIFRTARTLHRALAGRVVTRFESVYPALTRVDADAPLRGRAIERVELEGDMVKVVFHWFGKWSNKDGQEHEGRGNSVFIFSAAGSAMSLDNIIGDSPFGVVR